MAKEKIYINNLYIKSHEFQDGGSILKVSIPVKKFIEELQKHENKGGYVNIDICKRKQPDKYDNTHYAILNVYDPKIKEEPETDFPKKEKKPDIPVYANPPGETDDLPF